MSDVITLRDVVYRVQLFPNIRTAITAGKYDHLHGAFCYPIRNRIQFANREGEEIDVGLFAIDAYERRGGVERTLVQRGFRRAGGIEELLALGAVHPELQVEFPIFALGTTIDVNDSLGRKCVPLLDARELRPCEQCGHVNHERMLCLYPVSNRTACFQPDTWRYLAVC